MAPLFQALGRARQRGCLPRLEAVRLSSQRPPRTERGACGSACTSDQSEQRVVWRGCHHAALAVSCWPPPPGPPGAIPSSSTKRSRPSTPRPIVGGRCRRHRHPHGQRAARLRDRPDRQGARRLGRVRRHSRHAVPGRIARARRGARGGARRRRSRLGEGRRRLHGGPPAAALRRRPGERRRVRVRPLGSAAQGPLHVGVGADRARLPEALLVLLRVAHRRPGTAAARRRSRGAAKSSRCAAWASGSSRSPTTTSIR